MASRHLRGAQGSIQSIFDGLDTFAVLEARLAGLPSNQKRGDAFEVFAEAYLATQRITEADEVWPFNAIPLQEKQSLGLDTGRDMGVDGLYRTTSGEHRAYQVKFRSGRPRLAWEELSTFMGLSDGVPMRVLFTNCDALPELMAERTGFFVIRGCDLDRLTKDDFDTIRNWLADKPLPQARYTPNPHQQECLTAIDKAMDANDRTTVVMACGTGKTLVALWAAERSQATRVLVLVPSLALVRQLLHEWLRQTSWKNLSYLCVCSDSTVVRGDDSLVVHQSDLDFPVTTDPESVRRFLSREVSGVKVVFSTYQSASVVAEGMEKPFELGIFDEAHKTAGREGTRFSFALDDANLAIKKRLFFTATPRHYDIRSRDKEGDARLVYSMDNTTIYGPKAYVLPFAEAASLGIICDYKVIISVITNEMIDNYLLGHGEVVIQGEEVKAQQVAVQIALQRAVNEFGVKKIFSFHGSVKAAKSFTSNGAEGVATHLPGFGSYHVSGEMPTSIREEYMKAFRDDRMAVMSNARCLTEGVDVPAVDMVAFMSPRRSKVDIVQATGRAMRKSDGKDVGYVLVPVFLAQADDESIEEAVERTGFDDVWEVLAAMREQDKELADVIAQLREERGRTGGFNESRLRERIEVIGPEVSLEALRSSIAAQCLDRLGQSWDEMFGLLKRYNEREGNVFIPNKYREGELGLGKWVGHQRDARNSMSQERRRRLDEIGFVWNENDAAWDVNFVALKRYKEREGSCLVPIIHKEGDLSLGNWVRNQRSRQNSMSQVRRQQLDEIGFVWDSLESAWEEGFAALKRYTEREGNCLVSQTCVDAGFKLGQWVSVQRSRQNSMSQVRRQQLDEIGFVWDSLESAWEEGFAALKRYTEREGNCSLPLRHKEGEINLGAWVSTQRNAQSSMSQERKQRLDELGFVWDPHQSAWEEGFEALKRYKEREGSFVVPRSHREGELRLGQWLGVQRSRQNSMSQERRQRLDGIGFIWYPHQLAWEEGFEALKRYKEREGSCLVRQKHEESGFKLGHWVNIQRGTRGTMSQERKQRLDEIGFVWDARSKQM